jgi:hypothetical protein
VTGTQVGAPVATAHPVSAKTKKSTTIGSIRRIARGSPLERPRSPGAARFASDSLLEEAVSSEPVSEAKFPASWENTGNFVRLGLRVRLLARNQ